MNAERLLAHYERIADAPDAIARLRRFVLDLAVRGKLVPQDSNDEPASELLKRIAKENVNQADLPKGWCRAKVGALLDFQYGKGLKASERADEGPVPVFGSNGIVGFTDQPLTVRPSIIVGRKGSAGALNLCDGPSWTTDVAYFVEAPSFIEIRFLLNALAALDLDKLGKGVKPGISRSDAYEQVMCVPPLAEQHRIVAKVDELMALCDRLEARRAVREATRDKLTAASLARLNAPDPDTFRDDARFALDALPALTARSNQIKQFRQTILNLAVRGKLLPQDPSNEPASELLKRIAAGKERRLGATITVGDEAAPFVLPPSWKWAALAELITIGPQNGISPKLTTRNDAPMAITLTATTSGIFDPTRFKRVEAKVPEDSDFWLREGDLLFQRGNTREYVGIAAIYDGPPRTFLFPDLIMRVRVSVLVDLRFVHLAAISPPARAFFAANASGAQATMPKINQRVLVSLPIPLPPLAEQRRIVAKVDELMALCDQLEASLSADADIRRRLLGALLAEALAPEEEHELRAAE